jgi:uncharacterized protein UPF0137
MLQMTKMHNLLQERFSKETSHTKVKALAKQSSDGTRSTFGGLFRAGDLDLEDKIALESILKKFSIESKADIERDLQELSQITSEVRAINNQAAILHGERIMRAQKILKSYREGAFSAWLLATYGNRQTPYNFLLYYEFFQALPVELKPKAEAMPRQAVYVLASRNAPFEAKKEVVIAYKGQTKSQMLEHIRDRFPLQEKDKRRTSTCQKIISDLQAAKRLLEKEQNALSLQEKKEIAAQLQALLGLVR